MQDTQSAIAPLEKLVELHPQEAGYKVQLEQLQQQVREGSEQSGKRYTQSE